MRHMTTTETPRRGALQLRARITPDEYRALRVLAAERDREVSELVADALRDYLKGQVTK